MGGRGLRLDKHGAFVVFVPLKVKPLLWEKMLRGRAGTQQAWRNLLQGQELFKATGCRLKQQNDSFYYKNCIFKDEACSLKSY